jgi:hypothetical protein
MKAAMSLGKQREEKPNLVMSMGINIPKYAVFCCKKGGMSGTILLPPKPDSIIERLVKILAGK